MITFCFLSHDRLTRRQVQPRRDGGKMLRVPHIKLVRRGHYHTRLIHAPGCPHNHTLTSPPEKHHAEGIAILLTALAPRNTNCLLKMGKKSD